VATTLFLWKTCSWFQIKIWWKMSGRNRMILVRCCTHMQDASQHRKHASKSFNWSLKKALPDSSHNMKSSENVHLVSLIIVSKAWMMTSLWLAYASTITLRILPLQALQLTGWVQAAAQLEISLVRRQCTGWTVVEGFVLRVGIFLPPWKVDGWVIIWSFLVRFWVPFWCFHNFIIT